MARLGYEPVSEQSFDHPIEISGVEDEESAGVFGDGLDKAVAVQILIGEREQQFEIDWLEREKVAGIW